MLWVCPCWSVLTCNCLQTSKSLFLNKACNLTMIISSTVTGNGMIYWYTQTYDQFFFFFKCVCVCSPGSLLHMHTSTGLATPRVDPLACATEVMGWGGVGMVTFVAHHVGRPCACDGFGGMPHAGWSKPLG